jgi:hypothetical protein
LTTRIEREFEFQAAVHFKDKFIMNRYEISLGMEVETNSIFEQNIAMDRIIYFLGESLANSVFVQCSDKSAIEKYTKAGIKVCTLPEEPYDQIITMLLILKFNAITEGKLSVYDIVLKSELSDNVKFVYDVETAVLNPFGKKSWWLETSPSIIDSEKTTKKDKIVRLVKSNDWTTIGLDWVSEIDSKSADIMSFNGEPDKP